jgi:hypothetical protein
MKPKSILLVAALGALGVWGVVTFYKHRVTPARLDPTFYHTPEGVNFTIQEQRAVLTDALQNKNLPFIHGQMYYVQGLADSLSGKLQGEKKQRVDIKLGELKVIAEEIDNFAGRGNVEATAASLQKLFAAFAALDAEFKPVKK